MVRRMALKVGLLLATLLVGCYGIPKPATDVSSLYGHSDPTGRIVGGTVAGSTPYMVALSNGLLIRSFLCGGSLVGSRTILTAAHCIDAVFSFGSLSSSLRATVGTNRWNSGGTNYNIARNISHPNYVESIIKNDIGLLITTSNVATSNTVRLVALNYDYIGANVASRVTGWGRIRQAGSLSVDLLQLTKNTIDGSRCVTDVARMASQLGINAPAVQPHIELCTFHSANHGTCNGDSGSPLVRIDRDQQIGIVSWGLPCARGAPDMYVRVSAYANWLRQNIS